MEEKPTIIREGNRNFHRQNIALYLRVVGPKGTKLDYWCFMLKLWRLHFIINRYYYGMRVQLQIWPKRPNFAPVRTLFHLRPR